jgi:class 3 adenylate cyclase/tetratricopeptide (TPR) repeat protein
MPSTLTRVSACANCGSANAQDARFCAQCGSSLATSCATCGQPVPEGAKFCPSCGSNTTSVDAGSGRERRVVTLLFSDVTGSTALGERLDPERLRDVLDSYFAAMKQEIEAEGGTVEKYIGDAVVAAFGVPAAHEDDPSRAVRAALRMQRRMPAVNDELAVHGVTLEIRIGVNTGEVLASVDPAPGEPMFTGDAVNVAARFEQNAEPGQIVTSERTARAARGFRYRELEAMLLKGKSSPTRAFVVEAEVSGPERGVPGLRAPMVGRSSELGLLVSAYQNSASEGRPHLVTIYGDAGVGKSRLTQEFLSWAAAQTPEPSIVRGRCLPYGDGVTYWPLAEILKSHAGVMDTDTPDVTLEKIKKAGASLLTTEVAADPNRAAVALAYTVGVEDPSLPFGDFEPRQVRVEMRTAWRSFFSALAIDTPVVAIIEDIHWADAALLDLLEELADGVRGGVLFVCPSRPDLTSRRPGWGGGKRTFSSVALDPLTKDEADALVTHLLAVEELPEAVHSRILERAEGNPFFLEEIIRQLIDLGYIVRSGERWRAAEGIVDVEIPDTVQGVLAARIDLLEPAEKRTLQSAAVVGRIFWPGPVVELLGGEDSELYDVLGRLETRELVLERLGSAIAGELEYIFKHVLTRDVAYDSLPRRDRSRAHAAVAAWIERTSGERRGEFAELLAYHWGAAFKGERDDTRAEPARLESLRRKAFESLMTASEDARHRSALKKAMSMVDQAIEIATSELEQVEALERKGMVALNDYRGDVAWASLKQAAESRLEHIPQDRLAIARVCSRAVEIPTRWPGSMTMRVTESEIDEIIEMGFSQLDDGDSEERVRLTVGRAFLPFALDRGAVDKPTADSMLILADEAAAAAERLGRPDLTSAALDAASSTRIASGLYGADLEITERRFLLLDRLKDPLEVGDTFAMGAWGNALVGNFDRSIALGLEGAELTGNEHQGIAAHCLSWAALAEFFAGNWAAVTDGLFPRIKALLQERAEDPPYFVLPSYFAAAFIEGAQGETAAALPLTEIIRRAAEQQSAAINTRMTVWELIYLDLHARRTDRAREDLDKAIGPVGIAGPLSELVKCEAIAQLGRWEEAPAHIERAIAYAAEAGLRVLPAHLDRLEGRSLLATGSAAFCFEALTRAASAFEGLGSRWELARTRLDLAEASLETGKKQDAAVLLAQATQVFEELRSLREIKRASELMARL